MFRWNNHPRAIYHDARQFPPDGRFDRSACTWWDVPGCWPRLARDPAMTHAFPEPFTKARPLWQLGRRYRSAMARSQLVTQRPRFTQLRSMRLFHRLVKSYAVLGLMQLSSGPDTETDSRERRCDISATNRWNMDIAGPAVAWKRTVR